MKKSSAAEANEIIDEGVRLARDGRYREALSIFDQNICFTQHSTATSYYAVCLAVVEKNFDKAISLCILAVEREFYNPETYFNLGRIFLLNGQKAIALKSFRKGLSLDDAHTEILKAVRNLGIRKRPVVSFLPRQNSVNRFLGILAQRIA